MFFHALEENAAVLQVLQTEESLIKVRNPTCLNISPNKSEEI